MSLDPQLIEQARQEIAFAGYGRRTAKAAQWAALLGVAPGTIWRAIGDMVKKRKRQAAAKHPEYTKWAEIVFQIKKMPPEEAGEISTEDAVATAVIKGFLPEEALSVSVATYNAIARKNGWTKSKKRRNCIQAEKPNDCHHFDASTSKFLYIARRAGNELICRIHRPAKYYKNKPIPVDQLRPWIYGLADDYSGLHLCRYVEAHGENSGDSMEFLCWAWAQVGLPVELACDQGMLKKAFASHDWVDRLGVELPETMPYSKEAHGKIERPWRTLWKKFELLYFAERTDYTKFEISMTELNQELHNYVHNKYNQLAHRFERAITRQQAWNKINLSGGMVAIPENALATVAQRAKRKVDVMGKLEYPGGPYEVLGLHDAWVWVYQGVFEEKLVVHSCETGERFNVRAFEPLVRGEFRGHAESPHEKLVKAAAEIPVSEKRLYAEKKDSGQAGMTVLPMPIKTKEERVIEDPFDVEHFPSLKEAMAEFHETVGAFIPADMKKEVETIITRKNLRKAFVTDLALEIRASIEQKRAVNG